MPVPAPILHQIDSSTYVNPEQVASLEAKTVDDLKAVGKDSDAVAVQVTMASGKVLTVWPQRAHTKSAALSEVASQLGITLGSEF